ncbi:hypothetical protein G3N01_23980, partial|uniref:hypothetical protein n=1 Tax=Escherichia coli TaxID=562 RepID=UPI0013D273E3
MKHDPIKLAYELEVFYSPEINRLKAAQCLREQAAEIEALKEDAERYRWLQKPNSDVDVCIR